jgi:hypothetical protein
MATYDNCDEFFDQALASPKGIALELESPGGAVNFIQRMNQFRVNYRKKMTQVDGGDSPLHGKTPWDNLILRRDKEDPSVVLIEPAMLKVKGVREL